LQPGDEFYIPNKTFTLVGGIINHGLNSIVWTNDGTLSFTNDRETWPVGPSGGVLHCIYLQDIANVTFTSNGKGTYDGNGQRWWGAIKFLIH